MVVQVHTFRVQNKMSINYCYLITSITEPHSSLLIDPAWEMEKIDFQLRKMNSTLQGILLTHHHIDHINLAQGFSEKYNVPVYMSDIEINAYHFKCPNLSPLVDFEPFTLGNILIQPFYTPGHTVGSTCYLIDNNFFCGDTLFIEGCGLCLNTEAASALFDSLQSVKDTLNNQTLIYPGHSYGYHVGTSFKLVLSLNIYLQFDNRDDFIRYRLRPNQHNLFNFK